MTEFMTDETAAKPKEEAAKKLPERIIEILKRPLPPEAVSPHPTKSYLSTIKAIYVVERLNEAFGIGGWSQRNVEMPPQVDRTDKSGKRLPPMVTVHSYLDIPEYGIRLDNYGGNDNEDLGDAYKGAATDALTKMAAYLGIGMDVYKGLAPAPPKSAGTGVKDGAKEAPKVNPKFADALATKAQKDLIAKLMDEKGIARLSDVGFEQKELTKGYAKEIIDFLLKYTRPAQPRKAEPEEIDIVIEESDLPPR